MRFLKFVLFVVLTTFAWTVYGVQELSDNDQSLIASETVILDFYASWCPPCQAFAPVFEEFADELDESGLAAHAYKVNVDACPQLSRAHNIVRIPTIVVLKDGKEVERKIGRQTKETLWKMVKGALKK